MAQVHRTTYRSRRSTPATSSVHACSGAASKRSFCAGIFVHSHVCTCNLPSATLIPVSQPASCMHAASGINFSWYGNPERRRNRLQRMSAMPCSVGLPTRSGQDYTFSSVLNRGLRFGAGGRKCARTQQGSQALGTRKPRRALQLEAARIAVGPRYPVRLVVYQRGPAQRWLPQL
jgi:hypothetical protein